ncbi:MAG: hypothetical protein SangKO_100320 [Sandaracinaceae bacterium]
MESGDARGPLLPRVVGPLLGAAETAFDQIERIWESTRTRRRTADLLVAVFVGSLLVVELRRGGLLPEGLAEHVSTSHFAALGTVFTALLLVETVALVLALADSVAGSVGKQFELFSLILLRDAFKALGHLGEPVEWTTAQGAILEALADGAGALVVFAGVVLYGRLQRHRRITSDEREQARFVAAKKAVALVLLAAIVVAGLDDAWRYLAGSDPYPFFDSVFTALIFADVLLVLVSLRYTSTYVVVFRNAGFALATVILRLALVAPAVPGVLLGVGATAFVLALAWVYDRTPLLPPPDHA